jgi:Zn-dependent metalloprotease
MNRTISITRPLGLLLLSVLPGLTAGAARPEVSAEIQRLRARTGTGTTVGVHPATDVARFVRLAPGSAASLSPQPAGSPAAQALAFFAEHARLFGLRDARTELRLVNRRVDALGITRLTYEQVHDGVPVFAGVLRAHFDASGRMTAVNGVYVPGIDAPAQPAIALERAQRAALAYAVTPDPERPVSGSAPAQVVGGRLVFYRTGLVQGVSGESRLAYQIEVSNGGDLHKDVFVDARTGKVLDQFSRAMDALNRRSYDGAGSVTEPGPNYPGTPFWIEGQPFPTGTTEADNMILASGETYNLYENAFAYDSGGLYPFFPATSGQMHSIFNRGWGCPNASWNSTYISFCPGFTTDDVTSHEWSHAYTEFTSNLIYAWQSGAMNEAYSDIYGEVVDLLNGRGVDTPGPPRLPAQCSTLGGTPPPAFTINSPPAIAGAKTNKAGAWTSGPLNITANIQLVNDGAGASTSDGCEAFTVTAGAMALVDRGNCTFAVKADNAFAAGASVLVVANNTTGVITMGGAPVNPIPGIMILQTDGAAIKAELLGGPVNATLLIGPSTDPSLRWLVGEEVTPGGAIRDMWNPTCFANPDRVGDQANYVCAATDNGGVHSNSGVPNHLFALLTDGGTFNGHTVPAIGMTKALHLFFRAQSQYLGPASNFADLGDALEQSCVDLTGVNLQTLSTGAPGGPSGQIIGAADCAALAQGIAAVELRTPPTFCNFVPLLNPATPVLCPAGQVPASFFSQTFESDPFAAGWAATTGVTSPDFTPRAWVWLNSLPKRAGSGVFAVDFQGGTCAPGGDESGVIQLESPTFVVPSSSARLAFDHNMASEATYDGGNLKISVNGGAFTVVPAVNYTFNPYVGGLNGAGSTNPMAGQPAFSGADGGSNSGSWGRSVIDLTGLASAGNSVKLRWDFGTDGCAGVDGWYVDDVVAFTCGAAGSGTPAISIGDVSLLEGDSGLAAATFNVTLAPADPSGPHAVNYTTQDGTAQASDNDYYAKGSTLVFAANETSKTVTVDVRGDTKGEPNERFTVALSNAVNATIADGSGQGTIVDDDANAGDFNGDGLPDLVFRQVSNGAHNKVWFMDGVTRTAEADITPDAASSAWLIRGVNDFDNAATPGTGPDNKTDLVFWNQSTGNVEFWLMNGTARVGSPVPLTGGAVLPTNWDLSATADFNADARPDIVWRNFTSQKIVIWKMGESGAPGTQKTGNIIPTPDQAVDGNWIIVAAADYNNDGNTDFLWYNYSSGRIVTWYMDASVVRISGQFTNPNAAGDANWKVLASADYSRTYVPGTPPIGSPDIVWRNETSGNQVVWHLDFNSTRVHGQFTNPTANTPALDWVIVGPR